MLTANVLHAPSSVPLSEVQIQLVSVSHEGCAAPRCTDCRISIGTVTLEDIGAPPREDTVTHTVSHEDIVKLVNVHHVALGKFSKTVRVYSAVTGLTEIPSGTHRPERQHLENGTRA